MIGQKGKVTMSDETVNLWETTAGLVQEYEGVVREAVFSYDSRYNNGESLLLMLTFDVDPEVAEDGERVEMFTAGTGWTEIDGGNGCQNKRGVEGGTARGALFNKASGCGLLVEAMIEAEGFDASLVANPYKAESWIGLGMEVHAKEFKNTVNGEERTYTRMLPVRVWREDSDAKAPAKKAPAKKAPAKAEPEAAEPDAEMTPAQRAKARAAAKKAAEAGTDPKRAQLDAIAAECSTFDEFIERAYGEIEGLDDDADLQAIADDPDNWPNLG